MKVEMGQRVIDKITRLAPNFESLIIKHTTFTPKHMGTMFGAPGGDYCHGLIHPDQMGPNRPGPKGYVDQPIPIDGLYLGSAGCHGGPGITFIPGYNAASRRSPTRAETRHRERACLHTTRRRFLCKRAHSRGVGEPGRPRGLVTACDRRCRRARWA